MPKVSLESASTVKNSAVAEDRSETFDGFTVNFVTILQSHDLAPMLEALPGGNCSCPHWGYVFKGGIIVRYDDREEVFEAGDAFYMPGGHAPESEAGTELVLFSPAEELAALEAAMARSMQEGHGD